MKKYYSNYTGKQIDEAVSAIIDNRISEEDLSPELVATIKSWSSGEGTQELVFKSYFDFPLQGKPDKLYIAIDQQKVYFWDKGYHAVVSEAVLPEITFINCGGAKQDGGN